MAGVDSEAWNLVPCVAGVGIPPPAALGVGMADRGRSTDPSHPAGSLLGATGSVLRPRAVADAEEHGFRVRNHVAPRPTTFAMLGYDESDRQKPWAHCHSQGRAQPSQPRS